jgi:GNAT superfamily N-acetyltransferase
VLHTMRMADVVFRPATTADVADITVQLSFLPGMARRGAWRMQVETVRVAASHRGQGLGRQMLQWCIEVARDRGCALVQLTRDARRADAQRFYRSLGFVDCHIGFKLALERPP